LAVTVATALLLNGCIGSFSLFNEVLAWNRRATGNKHLNELIFLGLGACGVYEAVVFLDLVFFNAREFWTGRSRHASLTNESGDARAEQEYSLDERGMHALIRLSVAGRPAGTVRIDQASPEAPLVLLAVDAAGNRREVTVAPQGEGADLTVRDPDGRLGRSRYSAADLERVAAATADRFPSRLVSLAP
jgi:hypothetical protein